MEMNSNRLDGSVIVGIDENSERKARDVGQSVAPGPRRGDRLNRPQSLHHCGGYLPPFRRAPGYMPRRVGRNQLDDR